MKVGIKSKVFINSFLSCLLLTILLACVSYIYWNSLYFQRKASLVNIIETVVSTTEYFVNLDKSKVLTRQEAQDRVKEYINNIRYNKQEYIFITNTQSYLVLHPVKPDLSGKDMSKFTDPEGLKLFIEFSNIAKLHGKGFLEYMWPRAGSDKPVKKLSYIYYLPEWDWIVGTGVYIDDLQILMFDFMKILLSICSITFVVFIIFGIFFANSIIKSLESICRMLTQTSTSLITKSGELKKSSQNVKEFSKEQEVSTQSTASAISEISSMIGRTFELTNNSKSLANSIAAKTSHSENSMKDLTNSMKGIQEASKMLNEIGAIINEIELKSRIINEIVSKTELLSLNASIEAARAGEHGKGFAVVAEEVGNLAHMSGKSSGEIQTLLQKSREEIQRILVQTIEKVETGQKRTTIVTDSFNDIVNGIKEINLQMGHISDATKEQEIGVKQIANDMGILDQLAFKNAKESDNSLNETEEIIKLSQHLDDLVINTEVIIYGVRKNKNAK